MHEQIEPWMSDATLGDPGSTITQPTFGLAARLANLGDPDAAEQVWHRANFPKHLK